MHALGVGILAFGTWCSLIFWPAPSDSDASGVNLSLPFKIGDMIGFETQISEAERIILPSDTEFVRKTYRSRTGDQVLVSIVLSGSDKRSIHRPEICLPGQGWTVKGGKTQEIDLSDAKTLDVMNLYLERQVQQDSGEKLPLYSYYMYWFVGSDLVTSSHLERILRSMWDRIFRQKNHRWAYVIVSSTITEGLRPLGKSAEETQDMMNDIVREVAPHILKKDVLERL